jgi:hypothetical protein
MSRIGRYTYNPEDVQAKYETENRRGAQQWALGTVPTYPTRQSFPRGWTEDFSAAFIFDRASEKRIAIEMTHPFMTLEKTTRIALWMRVAMTFALLFGHAFFRRLGLDECRSLAQCDARNER